MWQEHEEEISKLYWGNRHQMFSEGIFICTIGDASTETIQKYIESQG